MRKNRPRKVSAITLRVPEKLRLAVDLLCERHQASISTIITRAIEDLVEREGLTTRKEGETLSLLDRLWDESEYRRLRNIETHTPELLSALDREVLRQMDHDLLFETGVDTAILDSEVVRLRKVFSEL